MSPIQQQDQKLDLWLKSYLYLHIRYLIFLVAPLGVNPEANLQGQDQKLGLCLKSYSYL